MKSYKIGKILENKEIIKGIRQMKVNVDLKSKPGEFFMFRTESFRNSPLLSRPFGVCDDNLNELTFLYQVVGEGTEIMAHLTKDAEVKLLGPLGTGFDVQSVKNDSKVAIVSGGIGIAPLYYLTKSLPVKPDFYAGFNDEVYFLDELKPYVDNLITTSDKKDGKFITEAINPDDYDYIFACGPNPMLKALHDKNNYATLQVSMEAHMACGIGACLGCTVETSEGEFVRVCKDGPVFYSTEVFS